MMVLNNVSRLLHIKFLMQKNKRGDNTSIFARGYALNPVQNTDNPKGGFKGSGKSYLNSINTTYLEDMHRLWLKNPEMVHPSWNDYFRTQAVKQEGFTKRPLINTPSISQVTQEHKATKTLTSETKENSNINKAQLHNKSISQAIQEHGIEMSVAGMRESKSLVPASPIATFATANTPPGSASGGGGGGGLDTDIATNQAVYGLIRSYQVRGHLVAELDPLGIVKVNRTPGVPHRSIIRQHKMQDTGKKYALPTTTLIGGNEKSLHIQEIIKRLEAAYCHHIGVEYMYIQERDQLHFIRERLEPLGSTQLSKEEKVHIWQCLCKATMFEEFLAKKWPGEKRFGLEGGDMLIPALNKIVEVCSTHGANMFNMCMAHRGRLNVLVNVCKKQFETMFTQFRGLEMADEASGDVKYHMGTRTERTVKANKKKVVITMEANPSHLEAANSVCLGRTRCIQHQRKDKEGESVVAVFVHGDAAFCGQGIVYETFHMSYLPCYTTHGTIHVICNNQVGFTTDPRFARSSRYCTDVARVVNAPVFHVNGDDPEAVAHVCKIAAEWRQHFHKDVIIDLIVYRRNGHSELDQPMFTQPLMYQKIAKHPNTLSMYSEKLLKEGVKTKEEMDKYKSYYTNLLEKSLEAAKKADKVRYTDWLDSPWKGFFKNKVFKEMPKTGIDQETLQKIGTRFASEPPKDFVIHKGIRKILENRMKLFKEGQADWAFGEAYAYASLLKEGIPVRLSGQDVERGTFAHRHHVLHHQTEDMKIYNMLTDIFPNQANYTVCNSALSELGILGFELGYALVDPMMLVMWEAQFGDFSNNAQMIFDQFLSSQEMKWIRQCGLVVQLPHAMEGQGPEHSSARLERFLSMCHDDVYTKDSYPMEFILQTHKDINWFVANCSTPASLFHILRRQVKLPFRKPLVLMTPKSVLKHPKARSPLEDFLTGTEFQRVIPEKGPASKNPDNVKRLYFCSGKTYYDIIDTLEKNKVREQIAVARCEQLSPFPYDLVAAEIKKYSKAKVFWAQEESKNMGGWPYMHERITAAANGKQHCQYIGRDISAAPASGNRAQHLREVKKYAEDLIKL